MLNICEGQALNNYEIILQEIQAENPDDALNHEVISQKVQAQKEAVQKEYQTIINQGKKQQLEILQKKLISNWIISLSSTDQNVQQKQMPISVDWELRKGLFFLIHLLKILTRKR